LNGRGHTAHLRDTAYSILPPWTRCIAHHQSRARLVVPTSHFKPAPRELYRAQRARRGQNWHSLAEARDPIAFYFLLGVSGQVDAPIVAFQLQRIHNQPKKPYQNHQTILLKTAACPMLYCPYSKPFSSRLGNLAIAVLKEI